MDEIKVILDKFQMGTVSLLVENYILEIMNLKSQIGKLEELNNRLKEANDTTENKYKTIYTYVKKMESIQEPRYTKFCDNCNKNCETYRIALKRLQDNLLSYQENFDKIFSEKKKLKEVEFYKKRCEELEKNIKESKLKSDSYDSLSGGSLSSSSSSNLSVNTV